MWDLLQAHLPHPLIRAIWTEDAFRDLYRWAQEIAHRAHAAAKNPSPPPQVAERGAENGVATPTSIT
jgi:hypothetical protein